VLIRKRDVELQPGTRCVSGRPGNNQGNAGHEAQTSASRGHASTRPPSITTGASESCVEMSSADISGTGAVLMKGA
jgi:hypothetical protein